MLHDATTVCDWMPEPGAEDGNAPSPSEIGGHSEQAQGCASIRRDSAFHGLNSGYIGKPFFA